MSGGAADEAAGANREAFLPKLGDPIRYSPVLEGRLKNLIDSVKAQSLEGLIANGATGPTQMTAKGQASPFFIRTPPE